MEADKIIKEINDAFYDIPFENSYFQTSRFVQAAQHTPARAFRALGLKMTSKLQALKELKFSREMDAISIDEFNYTIDDTTASTFDKRRAKVEIDKINSNIEYTNKLLNDATKELDFMYSEFQKYHKYTREEFEAEEELHFNTKFIAKLEAKNNGSLEGLKYMENYNKYTELVSDNKLFLESK